MIATDFIYYRPETLEEAVAAYREVSGRGQLPLYYGGGTEIITMARLAQIAPDAVIDLKAIDACRRITQAQGVLTFGAATTLAELCQLNPWPLLSQVAGRVADHSTRCKITLGGNIAGQLEYREAVLPFLLIPTDAVIAGPHGTRTVPLDAVFDRRLHLQAGEFLVQLRVPAELTALPGQAVKQTRLDWVDYPLVSVAAVRWNRSMRVAMSGLMAYPFRSEAMEAALNDQHLALADRVALALSRIPGPVVDDLHGSREYRRFVLGHTLEDITTAWEAASS